MSRHTFACFTCRTTARREKGAAPPRCPQCGDACEDLGTRIPVPPSHDADAWREVQAHLERARIETREALAARRAHDLAVLQARIRQLEALPENPGRKVEVVRLRKEMSRLAETE